MQRGKNRERSLAMESPSPGQSAGGRSRVATPNLPWVRFTSVVIFLSALDSLTCVILWLTGGTASYLRESVNDFSFVYSTFDLAVWAVARGLALVPCLYYLERYSLRAVAARSSKRRSSAVKYSRLCRAGVFLAAGLSIAYLTVKGSFIAHRIASSSWESSEMHVSYKILCIVTLLFPLGEIGIGVASWYFLRRLVHVHSMRLLINTEEGEEDDEDEKEGGKKKKKADLRRLFLLAKPEYPLMAVGIVCLVVTSGVGALAPYLFGKVIDYSLPNRTNCSVEGTEPAENVTCIKLPIDAMNQQVVILFSVFLVGGVATLIRSTLFTLAGERFVARLRKNVFASIMRQDVGFFDKSRTGELTNRLASDTQVIQSAVTVNISMLGRYTLQMVLSIALMFYISPRLTAVLLSVVPIIAVSAVQYGRWLKSLRKNFQDKLAHANSTAEESISNITTVRSFSNELKMNQIYDTDIDKSYHLGRKIAFLSGTFAGGMTFIVYSAATLVLWYGGYLVYHSTIAPGTLIALMLYTLNLAMCFAFLSNLYGEFMQALGASVRIFELMDRESEVKDGDQVPEQFGRGISFENVSFSYPSRAEEPVLKGISFEVKPGQVVALVGPSGGGKSTCVRLIEHFYEVSNGTITLGERDIRSLDPSWFRRHIGLVSQEPVLFACSIRDNITYGKDDATQEEIEEAAKQANAHDFVTSFENGYDTMVGERGIRLSGGQKQRIAIARALLLDPDILLLDEATSALDAESEHLVQEAIDRAMQGRTVLVIAHRLSTVRDASQVIVIEKGCVVEQGTHSDLLARDGVYKQLVMRQLMAGEDGVTLQTGNGLPSKQCQD